MTMCGLLDTFIALTFTVEARHKFTARRDALLASGAQLIQTDYPYHPSSLFPSTYQVRTGCRGRKACLAFLYLSSHFCLPVTCPSSFAAATSAMQGSVHSTTLYCSCSPPLPCPPGGPPWWPSGVLHQRRQRQPGTRHCLRVTLALHPEHLLVMGLHWS